MADRIATGEIYVEVNDREAIASLHRIDAEFEKEMSKIDRQEADVKLGADLKVLKKDLAQATKEVKEWEKQRADAETAADRRSTAQKLSNAKKKHAAAQQELRDAEKLLDETKKQNKALDATDKRLAAIAKRDEKIAKASVKAAKQQSADARDRLRDIDREARRRKGIIDQRLREEKADERAAANLRREQALVPKLERSYMRLQDRLEKLALAKRKAGKDVRARFIVDVEEHDTLRDMAAIRKRVRNAIGRDPIGLPVKPVLGQNAGRNLRLDFERNNRQLGPAAAAAGIRIGHTMGQKVQQGFRNITERGGIMANTRALGAALGGAAGHGAQRGLARIGHAFDGLANMTVRLGPFTATIRQLMIVMSLLGPTIVDVVGALGSLVSVTGSAAVGLGTLGVAIAGGGIPALIGMVTVLKPVIGEMKNATKASQNYQKAVREYGKGSDEATKKLKIFNSVMRHQTDETKANFLAAGNLKTAWEKATGPARAASFRVMGEGLSFLTRNVGFFGQRTNATFAEAEAGFSRWISGLDSAEGHNVLGKMMDNFNAALRPAIDGVGNLLAVWGRFGASASRFLPEFAGDFRRWTEGLLAGSRDTEVVDSKVNRMMDSLKSVGRFLMATGRLLGAFFGGGVESGQRFTDTMTNAMNRWTAFLHTTEGQDSLHSFFSRAVAGTQALYSALAPVIATFVQWSNAISPFATAFFRAAAGVANFVGGILKVTALTGPVQALAATLGTLWAIGKIQTATAAVTAFGRALLGVRAAQTGLAAASVAGGAAATGGGLLGGLAAGRAAMAGAGQAEKAATRLGRAGQMASRGAQGFGAFASGLLGIPAPLLAIGAAVAVAIGAFVLLNNALNPVDRTAQHLEESIQRSTDAAGRANTRYMQFRDTAGDVHSQLARANMSLRDAKKAMEDSKKGTDEHRLALLNYRDALRETIRLREQFTADQAGRDRNARTQYANIAEEQRNNNKLIQEYQDKVREGGPFLLAWQTKLREAQARQRALGQESAAAADRVAALPAQNARALRNMIALTGQAEAAVGRLGRTAGGKKLSVQIATKFEDPKNAGRVAASAQRALKGGVPKTLTSKIVADSRSAEEAVRRLNRAKITPKRLLIIEEGGKNAIRVLEGILGRKLTPKEQHIAEKGGNNVVSMLRKLGRTGLARKVQEVGERGAATVRSVLHGINVYRLVSKTVHVGLVTTGVIAGLNAINAAIRSIPTHHNTHFTKTGRGPSGGFASGGGSSVPSSDGATRPRQRVIERAAERASQSSALSAGSQKVSSGPRYLVGEEGGATEFIVSDNPAYRKRNRKYAALAARAVGLNVISAAGGYIQPDNTEAGAVRFGEFDDAGGLGGYRIGLNAPPPDTPRGAKSFSVKEYRDGKKGGRRRTAAVGNANDWDSWLKKMGKGEQMLGRELGIQEAGLDEPDSFLIETKTPDPDKPGETISTWSLDTAKRDQYAMDLERVREWYDTMLNWIATEARNLREAIASFAEQKKAGEALRLEGKEAEKHHKAMLERELRKKGGPTGKGKTRKDPGTAGATNSDTVRKLRKAITADEANQRKGEGWKTTAATRSGDSTERISTVGYDFRESVVRRNQLESERAALTATADKQLSDAIDNGSGGSGRGGGSGDTLSYGEQAVLADTERANVLREFGSNLSPNIGGTSGPSSPGVTGSGSGQHASGAVRAALTGGAAAHAAVTSGVINTLAGGNLAGSTMAALSSAGGAALSGVSGVAGVGGTVLNVTNNFKYQPADPHSWSQAVVFELGAAL